MSKSVGPRPSQFSLLAVGHYQRCLVRAHRSVVHGLEYLSADTRNYHGVTRSYRVDFDELAISWESWAKRIIGISRISRWIVV